MKLGEDIMEKVGSDIADGINGIIEKPVSIKEYFRFGSRYIAKKTVWLYCILLMLLVVFFVKVAYPRIMSCWFIRTIGINEITVRGYTGKVRLINNWQEKLVIFEGTLNEGRIEGEGTLYDYSGNMVCKGEFKDNVFLSGYAKLFDESGSIKYEGEIRDGIFEGVGSLYRRGKKIYEGGFAGGKYEGEGKKYKNEILTYEGSFVGGKYEGNGRKYKKGKVIYEGGFAEGKYEGAGTLYDGISENIIYEGGFKKGEFEGEGKEYDAQSETLIYAGGFRRGKYEGSGKLYSKRGILIYEGEFSGGLFNGEGIRYSPKTGFKKEEGTFLKGKLFLSKKEKEEKEKEEDGEGGEILMPGYMVIADVGKEMVRILREYMVPAVIPHEEAIGLCSPTDKGDYSLGIFLYDIRENESVFKNGMEGGGSSSQKYPSTYLSLYYMITAYSLSNIKFRSLQEQLILGKVIQVLKDYGHLLSNTFRGSEDSADYSIKMEMLRLDVDEKIKLRNMYDPSGRLSLYYKVYPVEIESTRIKRIHRVTSVDMKFKNINGR